MKYINIIKNEDKSITKYYFDFFNDYDVEKIEKTLGEYMYTCSSDFAISLGCRVVNDIGNCWLNVNFDYNKGFYGLTVYDHDILQGSSTYKEKSDKQGKYYNPQDNLQPVGFRPFLFIKNSANENQIFNIPYNPGSKIKLVNDLLKIEYGFYPQQSPLIQVELETLYQMGMVKETEYRNRIGYYDYLMDRWELDGQYEQGPIITLLQNRIKSGIPINDFLLKKYEYKGKLYTRVFAKPDKEIKLSNGHLCQMNKAVWLEDMPIEWFVKKVSDHLILLFSDKIILPPMEHNRKIGITSRQMTQVDYDCWKPAEINIIKFLNTEFAQEIVQSMDHVDYFNYDEVKKELEKQKQYTKTN